MGELEIKDLEAAQKLLKNPLLTLDEFIDLFIPGIKGLTDDEKKALIRLQDEEEMMHKKGLEEAIEDDDKRHDLEDKEMDLVRKILGQNISLPDFLKKNINDLKNLKRADKKELERLQKELKEMDQADKAEENNNINKYLSEEEALVAKASEILGEPVDLYTLLGLNIDKIGGISKPNKVKLKEIQDRLAELHKNDLQDKKSRREVEMDDLSRARLILNKPDLSLEDLLDLDISKIKNLLPSEKKELIRIQNELKLAHQADLKDALENENDRKNLEKEEMKAVDKILGDNVDLEEFLDMDIKSIKDLSPDKQKELERLQDELNRLHDADVKDALEDHDDRKKLEDEE